MARTQTVPKFLVSCSYNLRTKCFFAVFLFSFITIFSQPGKNGPATITGTNIVLNSYFPVTASIAASSSTVVIAGTSSLTTFCPGDLIMIYQAQGAAINTTNSAAYGDITSYGSAGFYEFKYVQSITGNTLVTQTSFTNAYSAAGKTQLVKVPQYSTLTINSGAQLTAKPWKDTTINSVQYRFGGLVVIHASSISNNGTITASMAGFRGGLVLSNQSYTTGLTGYVSTFSIQGGSKGESIFGAPSDYDSNGGRYCRGAPANGGGGGTSTNSSGGGGANGFSGSVWTGAGIMIVDVNNPLPAWSLDPDFIANGNALTNSSGGGRGGYSWGNTNQNALVTGPGNFLWAGDFRREVGGRGGRPLTNINGESRIYFGGGGGAGDANNDGGTSGGNGGGIVYLIATAAVTGTGSIESNGASVLVSSGCHCDGQGGGGGGGSIVIKSPVIAGNLLIKSNGGTGGGQLVVTGSGSNLESEGAGGGGGGGFIALAASGPNPSVSGGNNGISASLGITEFISNGGTQGAPGHTTSISTNFILFNPLAILTASNNGPVCAGSTLTLTAPTSFSNVTWFGPNGFFSQVHSPVISPAAVIHTGIYTVTANAGSCLLSATTSVMVYTQPTVSVVSKSITCNGFNNGTATITVTGGSGFHAVELNQTPINNFTLSGLSPGVYTVIVQDSLTTCASSVLVNIIQPSLLNLNIFGTPTVCAGSARTFTGSANGGIPAYSYSWTGGPAGALKTVTSPVSGNSVHTLTVRDFNNCIATRTVLVTFIANPTVSALSASICPGHYGTLTASGASNYTWTPSGQTGNTFIHNPNVTTAFTVIGSALGCSASAVASLIIKPAPTLAFSTTSINCAFLGSGTVTASSGIGPFSFTWMPTNQTGSVASGLFPGGYTVSVFDQGTGCTFPLTTTFTPLVPLTGTVTSTNSLLCFGALTGTASIALQNGSGNQTYLWTTPPNVTQTTSSASNLAAGINTVQVTDALTYCTLTRTFIITQPAQLALTLTPPTSSVCIGDSITFSANASGGIGPYTYTWLPSTPANTISVKENIAGTYPYSITVVDANNCAFTSSVSGKFVANPTVTVVSDSICPLQNASLLASGASTYSWNTGASNNPLILSPSSTTAYTVVGSALGCTSSATGTITVKALPVPSISVTSTFCQHDTIHLLGSGGNIYNWTGPSGFNSTQSATSIAGAQLLNSGTYTLKVTAANSCTASTIRSLTINPVPIFVANASTVCAGNPLYLYASYVKDATYQWIGPGLNSTVQNPVVLNSNTSMSGIYEIKLTSIHGCTAAASVHGSVVVAPIIKITSDSVICVGDSLIMVASNGNSYSWTGPGSFYSASATAIVPIASLTNNGIYTVTAIYGPCISSAIQKINVMPLPNAIALNNQPVCENTSLQVSASSAAGYTWTGKAGQQFSQTMILSPTLLSYAGIYTLEVLDDDGCRGRDTFSVRILPAPVISAADGSVCLGGAITLTASGGQSYQWSGPMNYTASGSAAYISPVTQVNTGIYTVVVTSANGCVSSRGVTVSGLPYQLPGVTISGPDKICFNTKTSLSGSGGKFYKWDGPDAFTSTLQTIIVNAIDSTFVGTYTLTVKNESLCTSTQTIALKLLPLPQATLTGVNAGCVPFCSYISLKEKTDSSALVSSHFQLGNKFFDGPFYYCFNEPGKYFITTTYRDKNNCVNNSTLQIQAYEKPTADFEISPDNPLAGVDKVQFYNTSSGYDLNSYNWFITGNTLDTIFERNHTHVYQAPGHYPIVLIAKNTWGCSDTAIKYLMVNEDFNLYVPDAFTPNGDGINDLFAPKGQGIKNYKLEVYNRWGEQIFYTPDFLTGWDGTFNEQKCKPDVYTWKISLTDAVNKSRVLAGTVTLLR